MSATMPRRASRVSSSWGSGNPLGNDEIKFVLDATTGARIAPEQPFPREQLGGIALKKKSAAAFASLAAVVLAVALVPAAGLAAKGSPGGGTTTATAKLSSSCNPCALGSTALLTGSGLDGSQPRGMVAVTSTYGGTAWAGINVRPDGTTSFEWYMNPAGTYSFKVFQTVHKKQVLKAQLDGVVVG
jgi:hypothetical protein